MKKQVRSWVFVLLFIGWVYSLSAENNKRFSLEVVNKPLPIALKQIEQLGDKNIIFSYNEVEDYRVTASIKEQTEFEAIQLVLRNIPFTCKERESYFVVQKEQLNRKLIEIKGKVFDEKKEPLPYANVLLINQQDSSFIEGVVTRSDGSFVMLVNEPISYNLKVTYMGYQTSIQPCRKMNQIYLNPDVQQIKEVIVSVDRPLIESNDRGLKANVAGTSLAKMGSAADMIGHLPFVTGSNGNYNILGYGTPVIYINGRKMRDNSELERLRAEDILSAEIITNPGVEYGADVSSVIRIRTIRVRGEGLSGNMNVTYSQGRHSEKGNENVYLNYRTGRLDLFVKGGFSHGNSHQKYETSNWLDDKSHWEMKSTGESKTRKQNNFSGEVGFNYEINNIHSLGMRYMPNTQLNSHVIEILSTTDVNCDNILVDKVESDSHSRSIPELGHMINGYYNGKCFGWGIDLNMDYLLNRSHTQQEVENNGILEAISDNQVKNSLYAVNLKLNRKLGKGIIVLGTEETFTNRHDFFTQNGFSADANDHIKQYVYSLFADYSVQLKKFRLNTGFRYEYQRTKYYDNDLYIKEQSPDYNNIIPTASIGYKVNKDWNINLSYRMMKRNPTYTTLRNAISYNSKYEYSNGNPLLGPQKHNFLSLLATWKWISANVYFNYVKDLYTSYTKPYNSETHPGVMLLTIGTIPTTFYYGTNIYVAPKIGIWNPNLTLGITWLDSDGSSLGITEFHNEPRYSFRLDNNFNLSKGWFINIVGILTTGAKQSYAVWEPEGQVNIRISKSFLKDNALTVTLTGDDILHTGYYHFNIYGNHTYSSRRIYNDRQRIGIQLSYRFNATKSKYKGKGAGQSEKDRL